VKQGSVMMANNTKHDIGHQKHEMRCI